MNSHKISVDFVFYLLVNRWARVMQNNNLRKTLNLQKNTWICNNSSIKREQRVLRKSRLCCCFLFIVDSHPFLVSLVYHAVNTFIVDHYCFNSLKDTVIRTTKTVVHLSLLTLFILRSGYKESQNDSLIAKDKIAVKMCVWVCVYAVYSSA